MRKEMSFIRLLFMGVFFLSLLCHSSVTLLAGSNRPNPDPGDENRIVDPTLMREDTTIGSYTQMLGATGIYAVDVDGDGLPEISTAI